MSQRKETRITFSSTQFGRNGFKYFTPCNTGDASGVSFAVFLGKVLILTTRISGNSPIKLTSDPNGEYELHLRRNTQNSR